jgi:polysaccharide export outer membrane protein
MVVSACETGWRGWEDLYQPSPSSNHTVWETQVSELGGVESTSALATSTVSTNLHSYINDYRIGGGDQLRVTVFGQEDLTGEYNVDSAGRISMPLLSQVSVGGLSIGETESLLEARLLDGYLRNPSVSVEVLTFRPFFVLGEVTNAGQYPYINGMTVQNAIALGGGYSERADTGEVIVTRQGSNGPITMRLAPTDVLLPGDTIYVRERWF